MTIHLKPELEKMIREDVRRGAYASVEAFLEEAVRRMHEQEDWIAENREDILAKIEAGAEQARSGQLLTPEQVQANIAQRKAELLALRKR